MSIDLANAVAADVMHRGCDCVSHESTVLEAARMMSEDGVGALPICGPADRLIGMLTDRDIVVRCLAAGFDPSECTTGTLASGRVIWCYDDMPVSNVLTLMEEHLVRRVPVVDREKRLVGIIAQADIARVLGQSAAGELVEVVSTAPPRQAAAF
jgi:CBS domain-containing protein